MHFWTLLAPGGHFEGVQMDHFYYFNVFFLYFLCICNEFTSSYYKKKKIRRIKLFKSDRIFHGGEIAEFTQKINIWPPYGAHIDPLLNFQSPLIDILFLLFDNGLNICWNKKISPYQTFFIWIARGSYFFLNCPLEEKLACPDEWLPQKGPLWRLNLL